jgi:hypothetical protein
MLLMLFLTILAFEIFNRRAVDPAKDSRGAFQHDFRELFKTRSRER